LRLAVWSPLPPSPSGIADYAAEQLPLLRRHADVVTVEADPMAPAEADLHLYHVGNSPAHAYVYRAAAERPGVLFLHDANLHHLVLHETVERGDAGSYVREMRRTHGTAGSFVARQVARALGGELLPALFPLSDRLLEGSLAVVGLTRQVTSMAARRLPGRPVLHLEHHSHLPLQPLPTREQARLALGLEPEAFVVTAPGLATAAKRLDAAIRVAARMSKTGPSPQIVIAGAVEERLPLREWAQAAGLGSRLRITGRLDMDDFVRHVVAADVVLALRFPSHGEMSGAVMRALGVGRPVLVTAGSPPAEELPEGVVVPVDPGPLEEAQMQALLERLRDDPPFAEAISTLARAHARSRHDLTQTVQELVAFLRRVLERRDELVSAVAAERSPESGLLGYLVDEVRGAGRELGLPGAHASLTPLLRELLGSDA
jgi:glycosyltransferase involved in cell wall biosynthesis